MRFDYDEQNYIPLALLLRDLKATFATTLQDEQVNTPRRTRVPLKRNAKFHVTEGKRGVRMRIHPALAFRRGFRTESLMIHRGLTPSVPPPHTAIALLPFVSRLFPPLNGLSALRD